MEYLAKIWYNQIKEGKEVKCPKKDCKGLVLKVSGEISENPTPDWWEKTFFYRCTRNCKHVWKYIVSAAKPG